MVQIRKIAKYILALLSTAIIMLFFNAVNNKHIHILANGQIIEHAHPYKTEKNTHSPFKGHKHSRNLLIFINIISNVHSFTTENITIDFKLFANFIDNYKISQIKFWISEIIFSDNNRAPPFVFHSIYLCYF